jgi:hypothetical protein
MAHKNLARKNLARQKHGPNVWRPAAATTNNTHGSKKFRMRVLARGRAGANAMPLGSFRRKIEPVSCKRR